METGTTVRDDAAWFHRLQNGEADAFRYFYDKHVGLVQYIGHRFGVPAEEKDDLVQEVFLKLLKGRGALQGVDQLQAWLATAARNWLIDRGRTAKRRAQLIEAETGSAGAFELQNSPQTPEEEVERAMTGELVRGLADKLSGQAGYEDFVAFYFDGKSVEDIASGKGEATGTVTSRLTRMRAKFRELFVAKYGRPENLAKKGNG